MNQQIGQDSCLVCGDDSLIPIPGYPALVRVTSDAKPFIAGGSLCLCENCMTVQKPIDAKFKDECNSIYNTYELYTSSSIHSQVVFDGGGEADRTVVIAKKLVPYMKTNILDIGAGNGAFLRAVNKETKEISLNAYDINTRKADMFYSLENFSRFYSGQLKDVTETFDLVSIQHVLEHVPDPVKFLEEVKSLISPDGILFIQVPDNDRNPFDILVADHVTHFYPQTLSYLLELSGYEIVEFSREWVFKEISVVAKPKDASPAKPDQPMIDRVYENLISNIDYLTKMAIEANNDGFNKSFGIFGSSISATWLYGSLKNKASVSFFVDEDTSKKGNQHLGLPILSPVQVPKDSDVYVPLVPQTIGHIVKRSKAEGWPFKMHFRNVDNLSAISNSQEAGL